MAEVESKREGVTGGRRPSPQGGARGARAARLSTEGSPARDHPYRGSVSGQESRKPSAPRRDSGSSYVRQLEAVTMLIGLVRDSVLQCFCHSCRAPVLPAATEIRCQEMSKGGLAYEVILAEPVGAPAPPRRADSPEKSPTVEEIQEKLKAAEERRRSLEASKMAAIAQKMAKIEEASRIRSEQTNSFITSTKEALDAKMDSHVEKREAYINELRARLKDHLEGVEKTRLTLEQQTAEVYKAIEEKMNTAAAQRDENLKKMLERLREHEEQVRKVRTVNAERYQQLEAAIQEKHEQAAGRRQQIEDEQREKLRNHNTVKLAEARTVVESTITAKVEEISKDIETKLTAAEQNREKEIQKKLDFVKKEERRAEIVRQNKNARTDVTEATSG